MLRSQGWYHGHKKVKVQSLPYYLEKQISEQSLTGRSHGTTGTIFKKKKHILFKTFKQWILYLLFPRKAASHSGWSCFLLYTPFTDELELLCFVLMLSDVLWHLGNHLHQ